MRLVLHFHDDVIARVGGAVDVVDHASQVGREGQLLLVVVGHVGDAPFSHEQVVEKVDEERLAELLAEDAFESPVGEGVNESSHG